MVLTLDIVPHTKQRIQRKVPLRESAGLCFPGVRRISHSRIETWQTEKEWLAWKPLKGFWKNEMQMTTESLKLCRQQWGKKNHTNWYRISSLSPSRWLKLQQLMKIEAASLALLINMKTCACVCLCVHLCVHECGFVFLSLNISVRKCFLFHLKGFSASVAATTTHSSHSEDRFQQVLLQLHFALIISLHAPSMSMFNCLKIYKKWQQMKLLRGWMRVIWTH